jgi:GTPase SAR1 family protein
VVGDQSSGKSSVLEALTDLPFPRDSTLCTRFATQIIFQRHEQEMMSVSIIPSSSSDAAREEKLKSFKHDLELFSADQFINILGKVRPDICIIYKRKC